MTVVLFVLAGLAVLVPAHLVALPLAKKRAVLLRGSEAAVLVSLALVCLGLLAPWPTWPVLVAVLLLAQALLGFLFRPWFIAGVPAALVDRAVEKSAGMVRLKIARDGTVVALGDIGRMRRLPILGAHLLVFRVARTKKLVLFQNVLRKCVQNYTLGRAD